MVRRRLRALVSLLPLLVAGCAAPSPPDVVEDDAPLASEPTASPDPVPEPEWVDHPGGYRTRRLNESAWLLEPTMGKPATYWVNRTLLGRWEGRIECAYDVRKGIHPDVPAGLSDRARCDIGPYFRASWPPPWSATVDATDPAVYSDGGRGWGLVEFGIAWGDNHAPPPLERVGFSFCYDPDPRNPSEGMPLVVCSAELGQDADPDRTAYSFIALGAPAAALADGWLWPGEYEIHVKAFDDVLLMDWPFTVTARAYCCQPIVPADWAQEPFLPD